MYSFFYYTTLIGLLGMAVYHPEPRFQAAIFFLLIANALFLYR